mmetsp:Transcript_5936/g.19617  ORF Transcript_5936/g.19617 Transcript_5936/m.19617 type:complete len:219 (+) Transcript_5936:450-1106(+)
MRAVQVAAGERLHLQPHVRRRGSGYGGGRPLLPAVWLCRLRARRLPLQERPSLLAPPADLCRCKRRRQRPQDTVGRVDELLLRNGRVERETSQHPVPSHVGHPARPVRADALHRGAHLAVGHLALAQAAHLVVQQPDAVAGGGQQAAPAAIGGDGVVGLVLVRPVGGRLTEPLAQQVVMRRVEREGGGQLASPADIVLKDPHLLHAMLEQLAPVRDVP